MKRSKLIAITAVLLTLFLTGIVFTGVGGGTIAKDKKYVETAESTVALMSSIQLEDGSRKYILWYNVDGTNYQPEHDYNEDEGDYIGKDVRVYYTKGSPEKIFIETAQIYYILLYVGVVLTAAAAILLGAVYIPIAVRRYVIKNGKTELVRIEKVIDVIGGQKLLCDSKKIRGKNAPPFKSLTLHEKISKKVVNSAVKVYYLPEHKNFYYVDTNTLKTQGEGK